MACSYSSCLPCKLGISSEVQSTAKAWKGSCCLAGAGRGPRAPPEGVQTPLALSTQVKRSPRRAAPSHGVREPGAGRVLCSAPASPAIPAGSSAPDFPSLCLYRGSPQSARAQASPGSLLRSHSLCLRRDRRTALVLQTPPSRRIGCPVGCPRPASPFTLAPSAPAPGPQSMKKVEQGKMSSLQLPACYK